MEVATPTRATWQGRRADPTHPQDMGAQPDLGSPRIRDELAKLGLIASTATLRKYRPQSRSKPSQSWRTFLQNHASGLAALDFYVVSTATFITASPTAAWTAQQIVNAFPLRHGAQVSVAGPRFDLWLGFRAAVTVPGHPGEIDRPEIALAKSLRRAPDRFPLARMPGSRHRIP
jgi:hypothetical protein